MHFQHSDDIWRTFPELVAGVLLVQGTTSDADVEAPVTELSTQYRSAAESLLRRYRKEGSLPHLHPLVDLCNAASLAFAIPVAAFDLARITGHLEVRRAAGHESYLTFTGEAEHPNPGEVIFADDHGHAHARRWTNRQSGASAVRGSTSRVLIVTEALHDTASTDVRALHAVLATAIGAAWSPTPTSTRVTSSTRT